MPMIRLRRFFLSVLKPGSQSLVSSSLRRPCRCIALVLLVPTLLMMLVTLRLYMFRWQQYTFHDDPSFRGVPASRPGEDPNLIPAIIHQSYKHDDISALPVAWQYAHESCKNMHPKYQIILWTDERVREFISTNYPHHLRNFDSYPYDIQRVDAARYFILYHYGGIYLDLDIECRKPLDAIRRHFGAVFPATKPFGVSNDFMAAAPQHPFFLTLIHNLPRWNYRFGTNYPTVMFSTGPAFVDNQLVSYLNAQETAENVKKVDTVEIMSREMYSDKWSSYFQHYQGGSWHHFDAYIIKKLFWWAF